jgi:hypothetical protein
MYVYPVVVKGFRSTQNHQNRLFGRNLLCSYLALVFLKNTRGFWTYTKVKLWILNFWRISLWIVRSYLLGWRVRLHGSFLILARTNLFLCCTFIFWEKYKRILNLHQSEIWTFVKLICELWVHFFGGETSWNISYFKLLLVWSCSPIGLCHEKSQWVVWELTYKKTKWCKNQVKLGNFELLWNLFVN